MSSLAGSARFTPSLLDHDTLEALFVHREPLVADAVARIERATATQERASRLFVGPRGAGKTHLISLIYHRARALPGFGSAFQLAWLPEDLWTLADVDDLTDEILRAVEPGPVPEGGGFDALRVAAEAGGPIVVLVENSDLVIDAIGAEGQRRLRAAMEGDRSLLVIGTTTKVTAGLVDQAEPFYGFFDTVELEPFGVDQAAQMLQRLAAARGDEALVEALDRPWARSRLKAVAHLAGGQPRLWALFGTGLTIEGLQDLVPTLLRRFDDLTPYYQEQMRRLSLHERKVVRALADQDRSMTVKDLAAVTGIEQRSLAKTMTGLRRAGWVRPRTGPLVALTDQRFTYYDLAEPLARLAFQLKETRGGPLPLLVEFLQTWFDEPTLEAAAVPLEVEAYLRPATEAGAVARWNLIRQLLGGGSGLGLFSRPSPELEDLLAEVDAALAELADGDGNLALDLPSSISAAIEHRLSAPAELEMLRWDIHSWILGSEVAPRWRMSLDRATRAASPEMLPAWLLLAIARQGPVAMPDAPAIALGLLTSIESVGTLSEPVRRRLFRGALAAGVWKPPWFNVPGVLAAIGRRLGEVQRAALAGLYIGQSLGGSQDIVDRWRSSRAWFDTDDLYRLVVGFAVVALASEVNRDIRWRDSARAHVDEMIESGTLDPLRDIVRPLADGSPAHAAAVAELLDALEGADDLLRAGD